MPTSTLYVLHPCLCDEARRLRKKRNRNFFASNETIIGEGIEITDEKIQKIRKREKQLLARLNTEKVFVSSTILNLEDERKAVKNALYNKGYYPIMSERDNFTYGPNNADSHDHCIDELLKCKRMICLVGTKYGGVYAGSKYQNYVEMIKEESGGRITNPSISLMEFYVGKRQNLRYRIFVEKEVIDEKAKYDLDKDNYVGSVDKEVFLLINFINHIRNNNEKLRGGNWWQTFESIPRLQHQISEVDFLR